jgi:hypothetical protein
MADLTRPLDTAADAHDVQREIYRGMSGATRLAIAFELTEAVRRLTVAGIRRRHPEYSEDEVQSAWARLRLGDELCSEVWPDRPLVRP